MEEAAELGRGERGLGHRPAARGVVPAPVEVAAVHRDRHHLCLDCPCGVVRRVGFRSSASGREQPAAAPGFGKPPLGLHGGSIFRVFLVEFVAGADQTPGHRISSWALPVF